MDIEDQHDIEIDLNTAEAWESLKTVGDIVDMVKQLIAAKTLTMDSGASSSRAWAASAHWAAMPTTSGQHEAGQNGCRPLDD
jgi:hypothetical protein